MVNKVLVLVVLAGLGIGMVFIAGCETDAQNTALLGTAAGAGIGALAGGNTKSTIIGAGVGGGAGYIIGNESDKKKTQQQVSNAQAQQNTVTVWITNTNGSKIPVTLTKSGPNFVGPRGEIYQRMPTEEELKMVYGF